MSRFIRLPILVLIGLVALASSAQGQIPYIGFVYPAGAQQGTTVQVRLGGQRLDGVTGALVTGPGVSAKLVQYYRKLNNQDVNLLRQQLKELKKGAAKKGKGKVKDPKKQELIDKIDKRRREWVRRPACAALAAIAFVEVTIAPDAKPGAREIRLVTLRGVSNPMVFHVGQVPEVSRKPMITSDFQVLGKEHLAQRKRPPEEEEETITVPCTMNGQIACGEVNKYRFEAKKGQRLVVSVSARELVPYVADAVPGWFQPVLTLHDADGKEVAFGDDYRFNPDPTIYCEVPRNGQYVLTITDALYRGREDFVYRITIGQMPFVTSIFPLGRRVGEPVTIEMDGWNLQKAKLMPPPKYAKRGVCQVTAKTAKFVSNPMPFALDTLPECLDKEANNDAVHAQEVKLPIIVNGRVDQPGDWDVFQVEGKAGETIVAEVQARRLDSPLDSMLKITDAGGKVLAFNDDHRDLGSGLNTHHADSYIMLKLPADGTYYVHLGDTARNGGKEYGYRLRLSAPRSDFVLRAVPSRVALRSKKATAISVGAIRKDGFTGNIKISLKDAPEGFSSPGATLKNGQKSVRLRLQTSLAATKQPVSLEIEGRAVIGKEKVTRLAVPAEDRMQAFLWRHLVPAEDLRAQVFDPSYKPPAKRVASPLTEEQKAKAAVRAETAKGKFTKRQVTGRLRQLDRLFQEWLLTESFYNARVAECQAAL